MKPKPQQPVSLRIDAATRADLDYLVEFSGLKQAQIIRQVIKRVAGQTRSEVAAASKPARTKR
jgi:antitoxin component of RelBE/YafQ-DinJ toxin-antitoxin module